MKKLEEDRDNKSRLAEPALNKADIKRTLAERHQIDSWRSAEQAVGGQRSFIKVLEHSMIWGVNTLGEVTLDDKRW